MAVESVLQVMKQFVGITCTHAWTHKSDAWARPDRPTKHHFQLVPSSPNLQLNGGLLRGAIGGAKISTSLASQTSWIAESQHTHTHTHAASVRSASTQSRIHAHNTFARPPFASDGHQQKMQADSSDIQMERGDTYDVHPAVALVATQAHYYDIMLKLPFEILSREITRASHFLPSDPEPDSVALAALAAAGAHAMDDVDAMHHIDIIHRALQDRGDQTILM